MPFSHADILEFQQAIRHGDIAKAQSYLDRGLPVDTTSGGYTALYKTIHGRQEPGYLEWLKFLLRAGADPNHPQGNLQPIAPLCLSVGHNICDATQLLLQWGADPNLLIGGTTCLHVGAYGSRVAVLQLLLDYGADFSIRDDEGKLPLDRFEEGLEYFRKPDGRVFAPDIEAQMRQILSPGKTR